MNNRNKTQCKCNCKVATADGMMSLRVAMNDLSPIRISYHLSPLTGSLQQGIHIDRWGEGTVHYKTATAAEAGDGTDDVQVSYHRRVAMDQVPGQIDSQWLRQRKQWQQNYGETISNTATRTWHTSGHSSTRLTNGCQQQTAVGQILELASPFYSSSSTTCSPRQHSAVVQCAMTSSIHSSRPWCDTQQ